MSRPRLIAAIDIGSSKITTLIVAPSEDDQRLNVVGVSNVPSRGIRKSQVVDIEEAISAITSSVEAAERMAGYQVSSAFVSVSGDHIQSQNSKGMVAVGNPEGEIVSDDVDRVIEAARAISLPSSREILHVIPRDFAVEGQGGVRDPLGMTGIRLDAEVHLISGSTAVIRNLSKCINEVGIDLSGLVFSGLASAHAVLSDTEKELGVILVDIGGGTTAVTVFIEGSIAHSAVLPIGAKNITNDLAIGLRVSLDSAEKIKQYLTQLERERMRLKTNPDPDAKKQTDEINLSRLGLKEDLHNVSYKTLVDGIIRPRLSEIYTLIGEEVKKAGLGGATPAGVVITGGGAESVEAVSCCKRTLQLPARLGTPTGLSGLIDEISSPAYATATGLILYGHHQPTTSSRTSMKMPKIFTKLPVGNYLNKITGWVKSLLP